MLTETEKRTLKVLAEMHRSPKGANVAANMVVARLFTRSEASAKFLYNLCRVIWNIEQEAPDVIENGKATQELLTNLAVTNSAVMSNLEDLIDALDKKPERRFDFSTEISYFDPYIICGGVVHKIIQEAKSRIPSDETKKNNSIPGNLNNPQTNSQSTVLRFSDSNTSVDEAFKRLNDALTKSELSKLFFINDFMSLGEDKKTRLVNNILGGRISSDEDLDVDSGTMDSNYFLDNLRFLLDNGVRLKDFSSLSDLDQCGFTLRAPFVVLLLNNEVSFEKLSKISTDELIQIENLLSTPGNVSKREWLGKKESSFQKDDAIEFVNQKLDDLINRKSTKYTL